MFFTILAILGTLLAVGGVATTSALAERRRRQEADEANDRQRFAEAVRDLGVRAALEGVLRLDPWASRRSELERREGRARRQIGTAQERIDEVSAAVKDSLLPAGLPLTLTALVFWAGVSLLAWNLDTTLIAAQGYPVALAMALGTIATVSVETLGLLLFSAIGVHQFPLVSGRRLEVRVLIAGSAAAGLVAILALAVVPLAHARADRQVGPDVRSARSVVAAQEADPNATEDEIMAARLNLEAAERRLATAATTDTALTTAALLAVFALSWAPLHAVDLAPAGMAGLQRRRAQHELNAVADDRLAFDAEFVAAMAARLVGGGLDPNLVQVLIGPPEDDNGPPPTPPVAPPPPVNDDDVSSDEPPAPAPPPRPPVSDGPTVPAEPPTPDAPPTRPAPGAPAGNVTEPAGGPSGDEPNPWDVLG